MEAQIDWQEFFKNIGKTEERLKSIEEKLVEITDMLSKYQKSDESIRLRLNTVETKTQENALLLNKQIMAIELNTKHRERIDILWKAGVFLMSGSYLGLIIILIKLFL